MKRLKKLAKVITILAIVLAVVVAGLVWQDRINRNALIAPIREAGDPVSIADLRPSDVDANDNAATFLAPVSEAMHKHVNEVYEHAYPENFDQSQGLTDQQRQATESILAKQRSIFDAIEHASQCRILQWPLDYTVGSGEFTQTLIDYTTTTRSVARLQIARSRALTAAGESDAAAETCLQGLRMVRLQRSTPTMVASMVRQACSFTLLGELGGLLKHHQLTPETHQTIEAELSQHDSIATWVQMLKSERAFGISSFDEFPNVPGAGWVAKELKIYVEYMNEQIDVGSEWSPQPSSDETANTSAMTNLLVPAINGAREAHLRSIAQVRCLRVLNAIQSRDAESTSSQIAELALPAEALVDPFSGAPLTVKKIERGWTIYSIGPNVIDDGGQVSHDDTKPLDVGI